MNTTTGAVFRVVVALALEASGLTRAGGGGRDEGRDEGGEMRGER
jgi:hypothetical protein